MNDIPDDMLYIITKKLNLFGHSNFTMINSYTNVFANTNEQWKRHYENLLDNQYIGDNSIHEGDVTFYKCRIGPYPGWSHIHRPIYPQCLCKKKDHYIKLDIKKSKLTLKNYKERTKNKYKALMLNDNGLKMTKNDINQLDIHKKMQCLLENKQMEVSNIYDSFK